MAAAERNGNAPHTYDRHFVLKNNGTYEDAFGNFGTW